VCALSVVDHSTADAPHDLPVHALCVVDHSTADVVILDRQDQVAWRGVEVRGAEGPTPREKHTLTALSGGRLLLFGGALRCCSAFSVWLSALPCLLCLPSTRRPALAFRWPSCWLLGCLTV
jgi:hypothetical protein